MGRFKNYRLTKREQVICWFTVGVLTLAHTQWFVLKKQKEIKSIAIKTDSLLSNNKDTETLILAVSQNRKPASDKNQAVEKTTVTQYINNSAFLTSFINKISVEGTKTPFHVKKITGLPLPSRSGESKAAPNSKEKKPTDEPFETVPLGIELETQFISIGKFIEQLENAKLLLDIYSIEIKRLPNDLRECSAQIKLNNYVSKDNGT